MGQLSSYSFVLLTIFYMQCKSQRPKRRVPGTLLVSRFEPNPQKIITEGGNVLMSGMMITILFGVMLKLF